MRRIAVIGELVLAVVLVVAAVVSWRGGVRTTWFEPLGESPGFEATRYAAPWLLLAALLVLVAGLFVIDALTRLFRARAAARD